MSGFILLGGDDATELELGVIAGSTLSCGGTGMALASVKLFRVSDDAIVDSTTADGAGAYSFTDVPVAAGPYYVVAFSADATLAGVTLPILVAV